MISTTEAPGSGTPGSSHSQWLLPPCSQCPGRKEPGLSLCPGAAQPASGERRGLAGLCGRRRPWWLQKAPLSKARRSRRAGGQGLPEGWVGCDGTPVPSPWDGLPEFSDLTPASSTSTYRSRGLPGPGHTQVPGRDDLPSHMQVTGRPGPHRARPWVPCTLKCQAAAVLGTERQPVPL